MSVDENASVYVLYAGKDPKVKKVVDEIKIMLEEKGIEGFDYQDREVVDKPDRDKRHDTMDGLYQAIANGRVIIMHLDMHYLKSKFCLNEVSIIIQKSPTKEDIKERVVPIVHNRDIIDKLYDKKEHKKLRKIVENTVEKYIEDNEGILSPDDIKKLNNYPIHAEEFFKILAEIRYQSIEYEDNEETRKNIDNKLSAKTIDLQKYLKEERERIEESVRADKIIISDIPKLLRENRIWSIILISILLFMSYNHSQSLDDVKKAIEIDKVTSSQGDAQTHLPNEKYIPIEKKEFNEEVINQLNKAEEYVKDGNYDSTVKVYDDILKNEKKLTIDNKVKLYKQRILVYYKKKDWDNVKEAAISYIGYVKNKQEDKKYIIGIASAKKYMGKANYYLGKYDIARDLFYDAEKKYKEYYKKPHVNILYMKNWIANTYEQEEKYSKEKKIFDKSIDYVKKLEIEEKTDSYVGIAWYYAHLGYVEDKLGENNNSIIHYKIAINRYGKPKVEKKYKYQKAWICRNLAHIYKSKKQYNKALKYYQNALNQYLENKNYSAVAQMYWNKYDIYYRMGAKYKDKAKQALKDSIDWYKKANKKEKTDKYTIDIAKNTCDLGWFYSHKGNYPSNKVVDNYTECINLKKKLNPQKHLIDVVWSQRDLANYYFNKQEYEKAESTYKKALNNIKKVVNEYNQTQYAKELAWIYHDIGASIDVQEEGFKGLPYFENALHTYEKYEIFNNGYRLTLNALQYIFQEKYNKKRLNDVSKKLLKYYESRDKNITWEKAYQYFVIGTSLNNEDTIYYLNESLNILNKIKNKDRFYEEFIPYVLIIKTKYYLENNQKEKATKVFKEVKKYKISKDLKMYYEFLSQSIDGNVSIEKVNDLMKDYNELEMVQILNLSKTIQSLNKEKDFMKIVGLHKQVYRLAIRGFEKRIDIYTSVLSGIITDMINLNINGELDNELNQTISLFEEKGLTDIVEMANLKFDKARYFLNKHIVNNEIKQLLKDALKIYKNRNINKAYDFKICHTYFLSGRYYQSKSDNKKSEKYYQKVLNFKTEKDISGIVIPANFNLAKIHEDQGYYTLAIEKMQKVISMYRKQKAFLSTENYEYKLKEYYNNLLPLYIKNYDIKGFNEKYNVMTKDTQSVMNRWEEEVQMETDTLVKVFIKNELYQEGIDFILKVFDKYQYIKDNEDFQVMIGDLYAKIDEVDKAKEHYRIATTLYGVTIKQMKQEDEEKIYIDLALKELDELQKCIKSQDICNRKDYLICKIEENNVSKVEITLDKECKNDTTEEYTTITEEEWNNILHNAEVKNNEELFKKYGTYEDINMSDAVEPIR